MSDPVTRAGLGPAEAHLNFLHLENFLGGNTRLSPFTNPKAIDRWRAIHAASMEHTRPGGMWHTDTARVFRFNALRNDLLAAVTSLTAGNATHQSAVVAAFEANPLHPWITELMRIWEADPGLRAAYGGQPAAFVAWINRPWEPCIVCTFGGKLDTEFPEFEGRAAAGILLYFGIDEPNERAAYIDYVFNPSALSINNPWFAPIGLELAATDPTFVNSAELFGAFRFDVDTFSQAEGDILGNALENFVTLDPDGWGVVQQIVANSGPINLINTTTAAPGSSFLRVNPNGTYRIEIDFTGGIMMRVLNEPTYAELTTARSIAHELNHVVTLWEAGYDTPMAAYQAIAANPAALHFLEQMANDRTNVYYNDGGPRRGPYYLTYDLTRIPDGWTVQNMINYVEGNYEYLEPGTFAQFQPRQLFTNLGNGSFLTINLDVGFLSSPGPQIIVNHPEGFGFDLVTPGVPDFPEF